MPSMVKNCLAVKPLKGLRARRCGLRRIRVGMIADVTTTIPEAATGTDRAGVMARAAVLTRDAAARC